MRSVWAINSFAIPDISNIASFAREQIGQCIGISFQGIRLIETL